jgi:N-acetylglucosaminyldiphosphoundecaprenol N-acetyl-beta-D-mannosaminyltransferase
MKTPFLEYLVDTDCADALCSKIVSDLDQTSKKQWLACINPHSFVCAKKDFRFASALRNASLLVPDGVGIPLFSRFLGGKVRSRVTGWDVFKGVHEKLSDTSNSSVFFLGSTQHTLDEMAVYMSEMYPQVRVVGSFSPPFKPDFSDADIMEMIFHINAVSPDVLWVGMTAPKQEIWLNDNFHRLDVKFAAAVGAVFDFCGGNVSRAPSWMQNWGLEWLHRSLVSPSRLGKRNALSNPVFIWYMIVEWVRCRGMHR